MNEVKVISADLDGQELRHARYENSFHTRCDGKADNEEIQDAINNVGSSQWALPDGAWERIFGGK